MPTEPLRSYGRTKGRALKPRQAALMQSLLLRVALPPGPIAAAALMPRAAGVWLEIGFGGGEHLAAQAAAHPDRLMIGVEPFLNGVASLLVHIDRLGLENVRVLQGDARDVVARLPDAALERVVILFPDPWPKTRHHKRRLMQPELVAALGRVTRPGGVLRFATDWRAYAAWTLERVLADPAWRWTAERAADWRTPPSGHVGTRYEAKALGDTAPIFLEFTRV